MGYGEDLTIRVNVITTLFFLWNLHKIGYQWTPFHMLYARELVINEKFKVPLRVVAADIPEDIFFSQLCTSITLTGTPSTLPIWKAIHVFPSLASQLKFCSAYAPVPGYLQLHLPFSSSVCPRFSSSFSQWPHHSSTHPVIQARSLTASFLLSPPHSVSYPNQYTYLL